MKLRWPTLLLLSALGTAPLHAEIVERIVARANGGIVTMSELETRQIAAVQAARIPPDQIAAFLHQNNQRLLQEAIDEVILVQRGLQQGIRIRPEYVDEVIEGIRKDNNIESEAELVQQLRQEGMSLGDLRRSIERSIIKRQVLARELEPRTQVTDAEALAEYQKNLDVYRRPESVQLLEIVVPREEAARELAQRGRAGEDFATLARQHSTAASRERGGDLGTVTRGDLAPALEAAAFALPLGGVSEPLPAGEDGWRILKVAARNEASTASFAEMKPAIQQQLAQTKMLREYQAYMEKLRAEVEDTIQITAIDVATQVDPDATVPTLVPDAELAPGTTPRPGPADEISVSPQAAPERVSPAVVPDDLPGAPPVTPEDEISVSPQAAPERVAPPAPVSSPSPVPPPTGEERPH